MTGETQAPITYPAALTRFDMPKDPRTRLRTPGLPAQIGLVHALNPLPEETRIHEPWYIEDPHDYRAALCGARVKVILPVPYQGGDPDACWDCERVLRENPPRAGFAERWFRPTEKERERRKSYFRRAMLR